MNSTESTNPESILRYWFGDAVDDAETARNQRALWWGKDAAIDEDIRARFGDLPERASGGAFDAWSGSPRGSLALVVLMDQLPRNMYRGTPRSFAYDPQARVHAGKAIALGQDQLLRPVERVFLYLPFEHSEAMADQDRSVALFNALPASVPEAQRAVFEGYVDYALRHREVIARFGRFPHRNAILGRASTTDEIAFLSQPGSSF
jgi:uncharacterized protein (DUF924 family)